MTQLDEYVDFVKNKIKDSLFSDTAIKGLGEHIACDARFEDDIYSIVLSEEAILSLLGNKKSDIFCLRDIKLLYKDKPDEVFRVTIDNLIYGFTNNNLDCEYEEVIDKIEEIYETEFY